ncbi:hypothetical protein MHH33_10265 [Paenisporosarcina sp. FSL H8-0542]|uniref:hypothetical protein n=1 Tax=Paenisporosarcina sp. FSL H8-0542 TaxID=2921401 RepID=UPI003159EAA1
MKKSVCKKMLISIAADAFRGHGFSLLVTTFLRGLQLVLFPLKSPPPQSTDFTSVSVYLHIISLERWSAISEDSCGKTK